MIKWVKPSGDELDTSLTSGNHIVVPICSHQIWAFHWMVSLEPFLAFGSGLIIPVMLEQEINH